MGVMKMAVKMAEFQRKGKADDWIHDNRRDFGGLGHPSEPYKEALMKNEGSVARKEECSKGKKDECLKGMDPGPVKKSIVVSADPVQEEILKRSLIAESISTIRFGWMKEQIAEVWEGPGDVACRDLGPFKCLLTFESVEARDHVLNHEGLLSLFFEMRPQWGFSYVRSRRVWLEVIVVGGDVPEIGEVVGETINGDRKFDVFVKVFGREMYSAQAHLGTCHEESLCQRENDGVNTEGNSEVVSNSIMAEGTREAVNDEEGGRRNDKLDRSAI
ncbi:hypothetical protein PIB30_008280 [Stylosanthes scabra]|uniref:DUF4283 domain-containing protein n=1 Tax=Stylosanthes scabra TaxID=79078 RepID=A0ABU6R667_9FABA|nr:hypothetical protein [Stylosanthes scabra]